MPILVIESPFIEGSINKHQIIDRFVQEWARWNRLPLFNEQNKVSQFVPMEHIPDKMARHDMWRVNYRRRPHMKTWTDKEIFCRLDDVIAMISLMTFENSPMKVNTKVEENLVKGADWFRSFTEVQEELTQRGLSIEKGGIKPERIINAAKRLKLPKLARRFLKRAFIERYDR